MEILNNTLLIMIAMSIGAMRYFIGRLIEGTMVLSVAAIVKSS
jgi:hypothetical protein